MPWQTAVVIQLIAGNTIINTLGDFIYDGTPGAGNLIIALAPAAGTDQFANAFVKGIQVGKATDSAQVLVTPGVAGAASRIQFPMPTASPALSNVPNIAGGIVAGALVDLLFSGPALTGAGINDWVQIVTYSNDNLGTFARGELRYIDTSGAAHTLLDWGKSDQAIHIPAGGGPFISGESFHTISNDPGITGTMRVKKLPWNAVWLDVALTLTGSAGGTFTMGSLPDSSYYPTIFRDFALSHRGVPTALAGSTRVQVPTSGAVQIITGSFTASGQAMHGSFMYPTN